MVDENIVRKVSVIFATDVVGYSKHMEADENQTIKSLRRCEEILLKLFSKYDGRLFNTGGDSFLAEFQSAVSAIECAAEFQQEVLNLNLSKETKERLEFRIGINMGDVEKEKDNLLGDGVNIAARLEALAQPNGITISKVIYDLVKSKTNFEFNDLGKQKVKQNEFHAYDIVLRKDQKRKLKTSSSQNFFKPVIAILGFISAVCIILIYITKFDLDTTTTQTVNIKKISDRPVVLIKPFKLASKGSDFDYIAEATTGHVNTTLSQYKRIFVLAGSTGIFATENNLTNEDIKENYNVSFVVEGTLQISGQRFRLSTIVTDLLINEAIASEIFEFSADELFNTQDEITNLLISKLNLNSGSQGGGQNRITENPEVYKLNSLAFGEMLLWTPAGASKAEKLWEKALKIEPNNNKLKMGIGWVLHQKVLLGLSENSKDDLLQALNIANTTLTEDPNYVLAMTLASTVNGLLGNYEEACSDLKRMTDLALGASDLAMVAYINQNCGEYKKSISSYERLFVTAPHYPAWVRYYYAYALIQDGQLDTAFNYSMEQKGLSHTYYGADEIFLLILTYLSEKKGKISEANRYFEEYTKMPNQLTGNYIMSDFSAAEIQDFPNEFTKTLKAYGLVE